MPNRRSWFCRTLPAALLFTSLVFAPGAWAAPKFKILHTVQGGLWTWLALDAKRNLFGVTGAGGAHNCGTIFELSPGAHGWTLKTIHDFNCYDGGGFQDVLILDAAGNLFGTSPTGGLYGGGNVFEMTPGASGWTFSDLYDFCQQFHCPDGGGPHGGVILDGHGNLYGTTVGGGSVGEGVVFELTASSERRKEEILYSFDGTNGTVGVQPYAPLIFDDGGNLFGTTTFGGKISQDCYFGCGSVFRLKKHSDGGWTAQALHSFDGTDGYEAFFGLTANAFGSLYGATASGGSKGDGVVFELAHQANGMWKESVLYDFPNPANGSLPSGGVTFDGAGNLYGTTSGGGNPSCNGGCGVVYKLTPGAGGKWKYSVLHKFSGGDGGFPGGVVIDQKGNLYGTAYSVVFEIIP
jgi:uncharacterized repeat protein (TIGR03803 family)